MKNFKKIINSNAAYEILDSSNSAGSTWTSGGCAILASALNKVEGYPIYVIFNRNFKSPEHFGVMTPTGSIIDADGEHMNSESWINFLKNNEILRPGELVVYPYESGMKLDGVKLDEKASDRLAELIMKYNQDISENNNTLINEKLVLKDYSNYIKLVSDAYLQADSYDSSAIKHWEALNKSNHSLFKRLLSKVNVIFTTNDKGKVGSVNINNKKFKIEYISPDDEYKTQSEMKNSFKNTGILKISIDYSEHPYFSVIDNIIFRTVHDFIAHILGNYDFGAKGEIACYNLHKKMAPNDAIPALFTEVVGQASTTIVTGNFPEQKIVLLKGFDYHNIGVVDDIDYEIIDKMLIKKGSDIEDSKSNNSRIEPKAIHAKDSARELELAHTTNSKSVIRNIVREILRESLFQEEILIKDIDSSYDEKVHNLIGNQFASHGTAVIGLFDVDKLIGAVLLEEDYLPWDYRFDIVINKRYRNKGYSTLLMKALIDKFKKDPEAEQISAFVINNKLMKVLEKLGFEEGELEGDRMAFLNKKEINESVKIGEDFIEEVALRQKDLSNTTALFIREINQGYDLVLYDPKNKNVYGTITVVQRDHYGPNYFVTGVATERGFGPFIYELAMMHLSRESKGLMPTRDGDVRDVAFSVWKQFFNRPDIKKETMTIDNPYYRFDILGFSKDEFDSEEEIQEMLSELKDYQIEALEVFNTVYSIDADSQYINLINKAEEYSKLGFDSQIAIDKGSEFWDDAYMS